MMFKPFIDSETSTISSAKIKHHGFSSWISFDSSSRIKANRKRTASRRVVKKKVTISAADNIIPDPDVALELGKSISLTEVKKEEAARKVYATHARIVIESKPISAKKKTDSKISYAFALNPYR
nr:hypothetical protein [Tanacetum cinerariifolium]